jgi:hypothetical protein
LKTLDALMRVSICGLEVDAMDLGYHLHHLNKHMRPNYTYVRLIVFCYKSRFYFIFNLKY